MTNWKFYEPEGEQAEWTLEIVYDEDRIIAEYYEYWSHMMRTKDMEHMISRENCIEDWVIINWAEKTEDAPGITRYRYEKNK